MPFKFNPLTGNLDLVNAATTVSPGGADTNVQYNSSGAFAGESNFKYDATAGLKILEVNDGSGNKTWMRGNGAFEGYSDHANSSYFANTTGMQMYVGVGYLGLDDLGVYNRATGNVLINFQSGTTYNLFEKQIQYDNSVSQLYVHNTINIDTVSAPYMQVVDDLGFTTLILSYNYNSGSSTATATFNSSALNKVWVFYGQVNLLGTAVLNFANNGNIQFGTSTGSKIGTTTLQKLAFWNKTPIVQPTTSTVAGTFVANTGTAVNNASTFDGYTIGKVVTALRNIGLLA